MATVIQIIQGATTVDINDGTTTKAEESFMTMAESSRTDRVEESIIVIIQGANAAAIMTTRSTIVSILERARLAQEVLETDRVYVKFQPNGSSAAWRSEILDYRIANETGIYSGPWASLVTEITISWVRRNYWEANTETQIPLTNTSASNTTSALTLYGHWDGGTNHVNYAEIAGSDVDGDLPAACRIEIKNTASNAAYQINDFWIGHNFVTPSTLAPELEAESYRVGGSSTSSSYCANGAYASQTLTANYNTTLLQFSLSTAFLNATIGGQYKIFVKFAPENDLTVVATGKYMVQINYGAYPIWISPQVNPIVVGGTGYMRDMWTTRVPPWSNATNNADLILYLYGLAPTGITVGFDFIYFLPVGDGSFLHMWASGYAMLQNERIIYDGINRLVYTDDGSGTNRIQTYQATGSIRLQPGKTQRLYVLWGSHYSGLGGNSANETISIKVYYRARRLTL